LTELKSYIFAIFAIQKDDELIVEPDHLNAFLTRNQDDLPENVYVLPWHTEEFEMDFREEKQLQKQVEFINAEVAKIDKEDPWVKEHFGIVGCGEGTVQYSVLQKFVTLCARSQN
jgi:hypothetical protein